MLNVLQAPPSNIQFRNFERHVVADSEGLFYPVLIADYHIPLWEAPLRFEELNPLLEALAVDR